MSSRNFIKEVENNQLSLQDALNSLKDKVNFIAAYIKRNVNKKMPEFAPHVEIMSTKTKLLYYKYNDFELNLELYHKVVDEYINLNFLEVFDQDFAYETTGKTQQMHMQYETYHHTPNNVYEDQRADVSTCNKLVNNVSGSTVDTNECPHRSKEISRHPVCKLKSMTKLPEPKSLLSNLPSKFGNLKELLELIPLSGKTYNIMFLLLRIVYNCKDKDYLARRLSQNFMKYSYINDEITLHFYRIFGKGDYDKYFYDVIQKRMEDNYVQYANAIKLMKYIINEEEQDVIKTNNMPNKEYKRAEDNVDLPSINSTLCKKGKSKIKSENKEPGCDVNLMLSKVCLEESNKNVYKLRMVDDCCGDLVKAKAQDLAEDNSEKSENDLSCGDMVKPEAQNIVEDNSEKSVNDRNCNDIKIAKEKTLVEDDSDKSIFDRVCYKPHSIQACLKVMKKSKEIKDTITAINLLPYIIERTTPRMLKRISKTLVTDIFMFEDERLENLDKMKIKILETLIIYDFDNIYEFLFDNLTSNLLLNKLLVLEALNLSIAKINKQKQGKLFDETLKIVSYKLMNFDNKILNTNYKYFAINLANAIENDDVTKQANLIINNLEQ